ncbi:MAG: VanZ family protein [Actinomycetales bacterium]|nr:VanZ family protein [Actinomycetales bacterium]
MTLLTYGAPAPERYVSFDVPRDLAAVVESFPSWGETTQLVINLVLLSWLACSVPLLWPRWGVRDTALICLAVAVLIEAAQWLIRTGRVATLTDVLINSLGGALVAVVTVYWVRPRLENWVRRPSDVVAAGTAAGA